MPSSNDKIVIKLLINKHLLNVKYNLLTQTDKPPDTSLRKSNNYELYSEKAQFSKSKMFQMYKKQLPLVQPLPARLWV